MGTISQRKGRAGELELARILQNHGYDVHAGVSRSFGSEPDLTGLPGVHIECKRVERLNVPEAMAQAARDSERFHDGAPAVFHRRSREPWLVEARRSPPNSCKTGTIITSAIFAILRNSKCKEQRGNSERSVRKP